MKPVHIVTDKENIAKTVLLPGDPLRAKYIAENFLENAKLINTVRNMFGYTGTYKGKKVTVFASGMGIPSASLYAYELFTFYDVKEIIRIGSAGAGNPEVMIGDIVLSTGCYSESTIAYEWGNYTEKFLRTDIKLNERIQQSAKELEKVLKVGPTYTIDVFDPYANLDHVYDACPIKNELMGSEMEGFGILHVARICGKRATVMFTIVDSKYTPEIEVTSEERETALTGMIEIALNAAIKE
ncbi:MAG: purine-nucleoside phosphorylase [Bacilli bacterium]|nr:purine-nucleoside phosphorylase [Bacilli bacterium]